MHILQVNSQLNFGLVLRFSNNSHKLIMHSQLGQGKGHDLMTRILHFV
jgi:hypothetical protein